eukprot:9500623-Pyramimonas_sp.AAC.1
MPRTQQQFSRTWKHSARSNGSAFGGRLQGCYYLIGACVARIFRCRSPRASSTHSAKSNGAAYICPRNWPLPCRAEVDGLSEEQRCRPQLISKEPSSLIGACAAE